LRYKWSISLAFGIEAAIPLWNLEKWRYGYCYFVYQTQFPSSVYRHIFGLHFIKTETTLWWFQ